MSTRRYRKYQQSLLDAQQPEIKPSGPGILGFLGYEGPTAGSDFVYDTVTPTAEARSADRALDAYGKMGRSFQEGDYFSGTGYLGTALSESLASVPIAGPVIGLGLTGARSLVKPVVEGVTPFFSKLTNTLTDSPQKKGTGKQFLSLLDKKGVKKEEQELTGIRTLLEQNPDRKFTSDELVNTAELNAVELEEVRRGEYVGLERQKSLDLIAEGMKEREARDLADDMLEDALQQEPNPYDFQTDPADAEAYEAGLLRELTNKNYDDLNSQAGEFRFHEKVAEDRGLNFDPDTETFSTKLEYGDYFQPKGIDSENQREFVLRMPNPEKPEVGFVVKSYTPGEDTGKLESKTFPTYQDAEDKIRMFDRREAEFERYNNLAKLLDERIAQEKRVNRPDFKSRVYQEDYSREDFDVNAVPSSDLEGMSKVYHGLAKSARDTTFKVEPNVRTKDFNRDVTTIGHYPESNQIVHIRTSDEYANINLPVEGPNGTMNIPMRSKDLYIQEIQSDIAQQGRDKGFADPVALKEAEENLRRENRLFDEVNKEYRDKRDSFADLLHLKIRDKDGFYSHPNHQDEFAEVLGAGGADQGNFFNKHNTESSYLEALKNHFSQGPIHFTPEEEKIVTDFFGGVQKLRYNKQMQGVMQGNIDALKRKPVQLPYTSSTERTNELALKRMLLEAVDGGYDRIAITSGEAVNDMFQAEGLKTVYDKILPKQLQKIVKKLDPEAKIERRKSSIPFNGELYDPHLDLQGPPEVKGDGSVDYEYKATMPEGGMFDDMHLTVKFDPKKNEVRLYDFLDSDEFTPVETMSFDKYSDKFLQGTHKNVDLEFLLNEGWELNESIYVYRYLTDTKFASEATDKEFYDASFLVLTPKLKEALKKGLPVMTGAGVTAGLLKEQEKQKGEGLLN